MNWILYSIKKGEMQNHWMPIGIGRNVKDSELITIEIVFNYIPVFMDLNLRVKGEEVRKSDGETFQILNQLDYSAGKITNIIGRAFTNKDGSINLKIDMIPYNRKIILKELSKRKEVNNNG